MKKRDQRLPLSAQDEELCKQAQTVAGMAYAPYSHFSVGAAARSKKRGKVYLGSNLENASYGVGVCAEVAAITAANSAGDFDIETIAIVGHPEGHPEEGKNIVTPCGRCRQIIYEASKVAKRDILVICCSGDLKKREPFLISELLPEGFGPDALGIDVSSYSQRD